jgi:hypothetical protein
MEKYVGQVTVELLDLINYLQCNLLKVDRAMVDLGTGRWKDMVRGITLQFLKLSNTQYDPEQLRAKYVPSLNCLNNVQMHADKYRTYFT